MAVKGDRIGETTGTYELPCGCRIFVKYPGCHIHMVETAGVCPQLREMSIEYLRKARAANGQSWQSLTDYIAMLRHVGATEFKVRQLERLRSIYPQPVEDKEVKNAAA